MKTPHRISLFRDGTTPKYNPETDSYDETPGTEIIVPCLVNFISQAKVFEEYGSRSEKIMICRFQQEQEPFQDAPIKGAVRLKKVGG